MCEKIKIVIDTGTIYKKDLRFGKQWHQITIMPLWYGSILEGFVVTVINVTVRRRVADNLARLTEKQKALFAKAAHDLNNSLLVLGISIKVLKRLSEHNNDMFPKMIDNLENSHLEMVTTMKSFPKVP